MDAWSDYGIDHGSLMQLMVFVLSSRSDESEVFQLDVFGGCHSLIMCNIYITVFPDVMRNRVQ